MRLWIIAAVCTLAGLVIGALTPVGPAFAQLFQPAAVNGCIYFSSAPTLSNRQQNTFRCDSNGRLVTG